MRRLRGKLSQVLAVTLVASSLMPTGLVASAAVGDVTVEKPTGGLRRPEGFTVSMEWEVDEETESPELNLEDVMDEIRLSEAPTAGGVCGANGRVTWSLEGQVLTIEGDGEMTSVSSDSYPWYQYREDILRVVVKDGVTGIGSYAFSNYYDNLLTVDIAGSVKKIGEGAFQGCDKLIRLDIGDGVEDIGSYAFRSCGSLEQVVIPDSVTALGASAFASAGKLNTVTIGTGLETIPRSAFESCGSLTEVEIPDTVTTIEQSAFQYSGLERVEIPDTVTKIGDSAFSNCRNLQEAVLGDGVTAMGTSVFYYCTKLESANIPNSITIIPQSTFASCSMLQRVEIADSVMYISRYAFSGCERLANVYYKGSEEDWSSISIEDKENSNQYLIKAWVHLNGLERLVLDKTEEQLIEGENLELTVSAFPEDATVDLGEATWSSSNETVATVEGSGATGTVTAVAEGDARIIVSLGNNENAVCRVTVVKVPLESIELDKSEMEVSMGGEFNLTVSKNPEDATANLEDAFWSSSDAAVATVDPIGETVAVKAVGVGEADITVALGDKTAVCHVTVKEPVLLEGLQLDPPELYLPEGMTQDLTVSKVPEDASVNLEDMAESFTWENENPAVATVDVRGLNATVTAMAEGETTIRVSFDGYYAECHVYVWKVVDLDAFKLNTEECELIVGDEFTLIADPVPENATENGIDVLTWSSSNSAVATVDGYGLEATVKAVAAGEADITIAYGEVSAVCHVTVKELVALESIQLDIPEKELTVGEEFDLTAKKAPENATADLSNAVWSSSNAAVATVEGNGASAKVKAVAEGTADITVKLEDKTAVCKVTVRKAEEPPAVVGLESIQLDVPEKELTAGEEFDLTANKTPENATADLSNAVWSSSDEAVATVEGNGASAKVKAVAEGTAEITVKLEDKTAVCKVTVTKAEEPPVVVGLESIQLSETEKAATVGEEFDLTANKTPENATADLSNAVWSSSDEAVATVEGNGAAAKVKAIGEGTAEITVALEDKTAVCKVTVTKAEEPPVVVELESIRLSESARALRVGQTFKLTVTMNPENATNANLADVRWTSSNEAVAAVDQEGNVKGIAAGSATITAALNGKTASCAVTVRRASSGGGSSSGGSSSSGSSSRSTSSASGANTWTQDAQGWRYKKGDNTWASNGWQQLSYNGTVEWYYFNDQGYMTTGWITDQGRKYYLNPVSDGTQGKMVTGWQQIEGKWYYFNEVSDGTRGALLTNTQIGEYYVNEEGVWAE